MSARLAWRLRGAALIGAAALVLHELRYLLTYGDHAQQQLSLQGHAYLTAITPLVAALLALAGGHFLLSLGRRSEPAPRPPRRRRVWAWASSSLLAIYALQEQVEGRLSAHHEGGFAALFAHKGWIPLLLAIALGAVVALVLHEARAATAALEPRSPRPALPSPLPVTRPALAAPAPRDPVSRHLAARGPPAGP